MQENSRRSWLTRPLDLSLLVCQDPYEGRGRIWDTLSIAYTIGWMLSRINFAGVLYALGADFSIVAFALTPIFAEGAWLWYSIVKLRPDLEMMNLQSDVVETPEGRVVPFRHPALRPWGELVGEKRRREADNNCPLYDLMPGLEGTEALQALDGNLRGIRGSLLGGEALIAWRDIISRTERYNLFSVSFG